MNSLSHEQAREYIHQDYLADEGRTALRQHLAACDDCRSYAAMHIRLHRELHLAARSQPTPAQRAAVLAAAENRPGALRLWPPLVAAGGLAALLFLATAVWLVLDAARPMAARPRLPGPVATYLAPFLRLTETPQPTATPRPVPSPTPAGTPDPRGRYVVDTVPAPSLAGNLIGEPLEQQVTVYLPPSYDDGSDRRYPVVYALIIDYEQFTIRDEQFETVDYTVQSAMNLAMLGGAQEMIVVIPDMANHLNLINLLVNSPVTGDWESYIATDLVTYMDANYRTLPAAGSRGLIGAEYHGLSALTIAMRHTDTFSALYLHWPDAFEPGALDDSPMVALLGRGAVIDRMNEIASLPTDEAIAGMQEVFAPGGSVVTAELFAFSYGMAFAPAAESGPPFFEYPYSDPDGSPDPDIWRQWESGFGDIPAKVQPYVAELSELKIRISSIDDPGTRGTYLSEQLAAAGVPHSFMGAETLSGQSSLEVLAREGFRFFSEVLDFQ